AGPRRREAEIIFHKRLAFAIAPFVFSLFGSALALRTRRGGRGFGVLVSLLIFLIYYLLTIGGDQAARAGTIPPALGAWFSTGLILAVGIGILMFQHRVSRFGFLRPRRASSSDNGTQKAKFGLATRFRPRFAIASFPTLLDVGIVRMMVLSFAV